MVTKTELYALDLRPFTAAIEELDGQLQANQDKLDDIAHAKETIASGMQGQSAQAIIAKLDTLAQRINAHMTMIQQTQAALTTYRTNKQRLQRDVIDYVDEAELDAFCVNNNWIVTPSNTFLSAVSPAYLGAKFIDASGRQMILSMLVSTFERYDLQAATDSGEYVKPYTTSQGFSTIEPDRTIEWDDDFPYGSKAGQATQEDYDNWRKWKVMQLAAAGVLQHYDSADFYGHFRENTGTPKTFDYEKAYRDDAAIRNYVNTDLNASLQAANEAVMAGQTDVTLYSPKHSVPNPATENWQRTIGGHTMYTNTAVKVEGDTVTATVTVYARDKWNFNRGEHDSGSGTPDAVNGRFEELGWGKSFQSSGSVTRTYTWKVGEQPPMLDTQATESNEDRKTKDYEKYKPW
ncbi:MULTISPECIES: hypothetical protein [Actinomycetes]|uniref:hypothetical protein n=1 Tax=Actinomycetes TaxID=1760 RepID=UPI00065F85AB|nr:MULTISPECIES: hypothetical protein [Actinomycetes]UUO93788.1 hypothetical protein NQK35_01310 [Schaalia odontolytica]